MSTSDGPDGRVRSRKPLTVLALLCGIPLTASIALTGGLSGPGSAPQISGLASVGDAQLVEIRNADSVAVLSGEFRTRQDALGDTEKDAALTDRGGRTVIGEVELEIPASGRENRRPELEVDIMGLEPRQTYTVAIDDRIVGTFATDDRGSIDMELQEGELPVIGN